MIIEKCDQKSELLLLQISQFDRYAFMFLKLLHSKHEP